MRLMSVKRNLLSRVYKVAANMNGMTVYSAPNAVSVIETMGRAIAKAQFIKCDNAEQGMVLAMTCYAKNMDFLTLAQKYDLIGGRLSMKSDAMLSGLRERGGKHKIIKRTAEEACVLLSYDGQEYESRLTWEEVQREPFIYNGKESEILRFIAADNKKLLAEKMKPKYATPRARMQMLWARAVSDGVRALCPEVNTGTYTPEEIEDFGNDCSPSSSVVVGVSDAIAPATPASAGIVEGHVLDAEFIVIPDVDLATGEQLSRMTELFVALGINAEGQMRAFKSVGATTVASVTQDGAKKIIAKMETKLGSLQTPATVASEETAAKETPDPPALPESAHSADDGSPASSDQIAVIKSLIESVSQKEGMGSVPGRIKEHLNRHGISKFAHMTFLSAQSLIDSLNGTTGLEDFFDVAPKSATGFAS
jgi:hypothetical protein